MYTEIKYLNLLSIRLEKFKQKKDYLWNFRCPVCGDSQRFKNKARGFVFQIKGKLVYKCHNCSVGMSLPNLIETIDPILYKEYRLEKFKETNPHQKVDMRKVKKIVSQKPTFKKDILSDITPLNKLNIAHPAKEYILKRQLPTESLYYTETFKAWTNSVKPGTFQEVTPDEPRIIIPFRDKEGNTFGYQGRALSDTTLRYITILLNEEQPKIFGLDRLNETQTIYITEGPFDSLLLHNAIAMAGADVALTDLDSNHIHTGNVSRVFVMDNEPRNLQITARLQKLIGEGESVVIWPTEIKQKDINDMHLAGIDVNQIVSNHTYTGLNATLKFNEWKR